MLSGCCAVAGLGMGNATEKQLATSDALHEKICRGFDRLAK